MGEERTYYTAEAYRVVTNEEGTPSYDAGENLLQEKISPLLQEIAATSTSMVSKDRVGVLFCGW